MTRNIGGWCAGNSQYEEIESVALRNKAAITLTVSRVEAIKETGESAAHKHNAFRNFSDDIVEKQRRYAGGWVPGALAFSKEAVRMK